MDLACEVVLGVVGIVELAVIRPAGIGQIMPPASCSRPSG